MALGHVGALDDDAVSLLEVLQKAGGAATAERGSQTGNRCTVSNTRLVLDLYGAHRGEELLDQVVLFVVQRGAAEGREAHRAPERTALFVGVLPVPTSRLDHPVGDHVGG